MAKKAVPHSEVDELRETVAAYVAAGADESVQRVITAVHRVSRRLNQWYDQQLADLDVTSGEWAVLDALARADSERPDPVPARRGRARGALLDDPPARPDGRLGRCSPATSIRPTGRASWSG